MSIRKLDAIRRSVKANALAAKFAHRIIGQPRAVDALVAVLEKYQAGFYDRTKPIASLLFLGPTGCGKTGAVEAFAEGIFGKPTAMMKINASEFAHSHEIARLIGSPAGYLGHRETHPFFTNASVKSYQTPDCPFTIILVDEIEKASDSLWNLLLGILDKGQLTTGTNEVVDMTSTIIIMTSNVGSSELAAKIGDGGIGFLKAGETISWDNMKEVAMSAARRKFMPEFLNRLDDAVVFNTLTPENLDQIFQLELDRLRERIVLTSLAIFDIQVSPAAKKQLLIEGYDRKYNARNLKRVLDQKVSTPIARFVATGQVVNNDVLVVDYVNEKWEYYAKGEVAGQPTTGSLSKGRVEVPSVFKPIQSRPAPPEVSKQWRNPYDGEPHNSLRDVPSDVARRETDSGVDRPRWWLK